MATATELTLTLGRTVYGGDPDSDQRVQAREARVSVTWSLGEDEQDLTLTTSVLAEEAERALAQVGEARPDAEGRKPSPNGRADAPATTSPATSGTNGDGHSGGGYAGSGTGYAQPAAGGQVRGSATNDGYANGGTATVPAGTTTARYGGYSPARAEAAAKAPCPAITKAQCLAVRSHCTRRGVAPWELMRLIAEHFGKHSLESLDKAQGGELLTLLQQEEHEYEPGNPDYAN